MITYDEAFIWFIMNLSALTAIHLDFSISVPPTISETSSSPPLQTIIPGTSFAVECVIQAVPDAKVCRFQNLGFFLH